MLEQLYAISKNTLIESIRQPIYLVLIGVGMLALVFIPGLSTFTLDDDNQFLVSMGLATIFLIGLFIAAFVATSVITREIENKTVLTVVSKPVSRPIFILGKYIGVTLSIIIAALILSLAFMIVKRNGVLQTARDTLDYPAITFGVAAVVLSLGIALVGNYFWGWVFTGTTVLLLLPLIFLAWVGTICIDKNWVLQISLITHTDRGDYLSILPGVDWQLLLAVAGVMMGLMIISSVAIAASTRCGQVMTVFICLVVFLAGLLTDTLFGRRAFETKTIARIRDIHTIRDLNENFSDDGDRYSVRLDKGLDLKDGLKVYVSSDNLGFGMLCRNPGPGDPPTAMIKINNYNTADLIRLGSSPAQRPPRIGDFLVAHPPVVHPLWRIVWSIPPNMQFLFLTDALTQGNPIPMSHMELLAGYTGLYVLGMLSLSVVLFQTREVG